jgi:hypothetical protein
MGIASRCLAVHHGLASEAALQRPPSLLGSLALPFLATQRQSAELGKRHTSGRRFGQQAPGGHTRLIEEHRKETELAHED